MIQITGKLYNVTSSQAPDFKTGEIVTTHTAELIHSVRGKTEVSSFKVDPSVLLTWSKAIGRDISAEIRFYAMKNREGGVMSGIVLADKKSLPVVHQQAAVAPAPPVRAAA